MIKDNGVVSSDVFTTVPPPPGFVWKGVADVSDTCFSTFRDRFYLVSARTGRRFTVDFDHTERSPDGSEIVAWHYSGEAVLADKPYETGKIQITLFND